MSKQYLYRVSILNRKTSHPLESISHYSGETQFDSGNNKNYITNTADNVIWTKILTPEKDNMVAYKELPDYLKFRSNKKDIISNARNILWQNVHNREKRDDAQFARLFEVLIPSFLSKDEAVDLLSKFAKNLVDEGMIVDSSIHSRKKESNNISILEKIKNNDTENETEKLKNDFLDYNGYLMCTLRDYNSGFFVNKNRGWNDKTKMETWRYKWVELLAEYVQNSSVSDEIKKSWDDKLSIYTEYNAIKSILRNKKQEYTPMHASI